MSDEQSPAPTARTSIGTIVMMVAGALLLLPGLCTIVVVAMLAVDKPDNPFSDPYVRFFIPFMVLCLLLSLGGILLIVAARRRRQRGGDQRGQA